MINLENDLLEQIKEFISKFAAIPVEKIKIDSLLENDLKIYGDDALDLIISYSKKFNVDVDSFDAKKYIASEGDTFFPLLIRIFTRKRGIIRKDIKILDLVNGIIDGKLNLA